MPHVSARLRTQTMDALYTALGGFEAHLAHIEKSQENRAEFYKQWAKGAAKPHSVEHSVNPDSVENLLARLDERDAQKRVASNVIDVESHAVEADDASD